MRRFSVVRTTAALGLVLALVGCSARDERAAHDPAARAVPLVLQGQRDKADPAVVALRMGADDYCTGTVVAPAFVLTAAHCFDKGGPTSVSFRSSNIYGGAGWAPAKAVHVEPGWTPGSFQHDIALVELAAPTDVTPIPINVDAGAAKRIDHVRMVGFGPTGTHFGDEGTKRSAEVPVHAEWDFFHTEPGTGSCYGDSGGPSFATIDGVEKVVAVTSHGLHELCERSGGRIVRTDQHRAFLAQYLELAREAAAEAPAPIAATPPEPAAPSAPASPSSPPSSSSPSATPIECTGSEQVFLTHASVSVAEGAAVRASGSCQIILVDVDVKGPVGVQATGSAQVVMTRGHIDAAKPFTTSGSAQVNLVGTETRGS